MMRVPVTYQSVRVGIATVEEDGTVKMYLAAGSPFGENLLRSIDRGLVDGFSIKPNVVPAKTAIAPPKIVRNAGNHH